MSDYRVIESDSPSHLGFKVAAYIRDGWKVAGGITVAGNRYMQAIYFEEKSHDPAR